MTLHDRAARVIAAVNAEESDSASHDLLNRGQLVSQQLRSTRLVAVDAAKLRGQFGFGQPQIDLKALPKKLGALERRLAEKSLQAVDGKDASNAEDEAREFSRRLAFWAGREWEDRHRAAIASIKVVDELAIQGRPETRQQIRNDRNRLASILKHNPLTQQAELLASLDVRDLVGASEAIDARTRRLDELLSELRSQAEDFSPTVKAALGAAATEDGLPLGSISAELLAELIEAGVADTLTVHS